MLRDSPHWLAVCSLLSLSFAGCAKPQSAAAGAPVVIISVDTLRADHLRAYGYHGVETPAIDALAADSILFQNAYSNVPLTLPSHATLLTGLLPYETGVRDNMGFRLSAGHATLAEILRSRSYATGAAVSAFVLRKDRGLAAGFDSWDDSGQENATRERAGLDSAAALEKWAATVRGRPIFLFLHIYEPHYPYTPPEPYRSRYASSLYDGEIAAADAAVGSFVAFLKREGIYDRSILVFLSDHGEGLGEHGEQEHGVFLYREAIHVPLLVKRPGSAGKGRAVSAPVSLTDVVPTVLSALSIPIPENLHGLSLLATEPRGDRRIYSETFYPRLGLGWSDLASLVDSRYHYIHAPRPELYDWNSDPTERKDLAPGLPGPFRSMRTALEAMNRPFAPPEASSPEELKKLAALGYINVSPGAGGGPLADPKDKVDALREFRRVFESYFAGRYGETIVAARALVVREPNVFLAWTMLSDSLERTGRRSEAIEALRSGIARARPDSPSAEQLQQAYDGLSLLLQKAGDAAGQERALREAAGRGLASEPMKRDLARLYVASGKNADAVTLLTSGPPRAEAASLDTLGVALARSGRQSEAKQAFLQALAIEPGNAGVAFNMGTLLMDGGDAAGARDWFQKSVQSDPRSAAGWAELGLAQARLGDADGAAQSWRQAIALDPGQYGALYNLAVWELKAGRFDDARGRLERFLASAPRPRFAEQLAQARQLLAELKRRTGSSKP